MAVSSFQAAYPGGVSARPAECGGEPLLPPIASDGEDDRDARGCSLGRPRGGFAARRREDAHASMNKLRRHRRQPVILADCPAVFDRHVLALDEAALALGTRPRDALYPRGTSR